MHGFNDIEREFERFEAEIQQIPASSGPRPQQQQKSTAFIPPQLRARLGLGQPNAPRPPPPPMAPSFNARPTYQPAMTIPVSSFGPGWIPAVRPKVIIEAKPIRYDESAASAAPPSTATTASAPPQLGPSDALARAKAVLESLKVKTETAPTPNAIAESIQMALSKSSSSAGNASAIPLPLNMPGGSASVPSSASIKKAAGAKAGTSGASSSTDPEYFSGVRKAGGEVWTDVTLFEWDPNDHRLFCGDLGNETTDESLAKVFSIYPSFLKAKVIRDKRTNKTRGFGFVSFKDAQDLARAIREMNGKYVGNRPIKLRKSSWKDRNIDLVKKKEKVKKKLGLHY